MKNFKEVFERYKNNGATEDEIKYIQGEIEKSEIISDYLAEQLELDLPLDIDITETNSSTDGIKKAVNKKLMKIVAISVISVFALLGISKYIVSPIVDSVYFNPTATTMGNEWVEDFEFDILAFTELTMPGVEVDFFHTSKQGYGKYNVMSKFEDTFTKEVTNIDFDIVRGRLLGDLGYFHDKRSNHIVNFQRHELSESFFENRYKHMEDELANLPTTSYVSSFVHLDKNIDMNQLFSLSEKHSNLDFLWVGIETEKPELPEGYESGSYSASIHMVLGFRPGFPSRSFNDSPNKELYPLFTLSDFMDNGNWRKYSLDSGNFGSTYEEHFKSLLKYLYNRDNFLDIFKISSLKKEYINNALKYVETNGITTNLILVYGHPEDIINLEKSEENVVATEIYNVKASKYSK